MPTDHIIDGHSAFSELSLVKTLGLKLAADAGELISRRRASNLVEISHKSLVDLVTNVDMEVEKLILDAIHENFPDHKILSEETHPVISDRSQYLGPLWIIDPIDGTLNFAHGLPACGVSIAFSFGGKVLFGAVHAPFLGELFHATLGDGAFVNGRPIRVSEVSQLDHALCAMGFPHNRREISAQLSHQVCTMLMRCQDVRRVGSAAIDLCWVASGRMELYFEDINPWDIAAGGLIVREAGGRTGHYAPNTVNPDLPDDLNAYRFIAANDHLYPQAFELLRGTLLPSECI